MREIRRLQSQSCLMEVEHLSTNRETMDSIEDEYPLSLSISLERDGGYDEIWIGINMKIKGAEL